MVLRLERPSLALVDAFAAFRDACTASGDGEWIRDLAIAYTDPPAYVAMIQSWAAGADAPQWEAPGDTFWIVENGEVVGDCDVRPRLTPWLKRKGGHIGYLVHPAHRGRGIATFALREGLTYLGAQRSVALLTCAHANAASIRVIEKCGGRRIADSQRRRFLVPTGALPPALRPATPADRPFVEGTYFQTQRYIIDALFGWRGNAIEDRKFAEVYDPARARIISLGADDIGWMAVDRRSGHIELEHLYIADAYQGHGIGTLLVSDLMEEAAAGIPLRLATAKINRARELYAMLGFRLVAEDEYKVYLEVHRVG